MIFNFKNKNEIEKLEIEINTLKQQNLSLKEERHQANQSNMALSHF
jgi:predicted  nucleic acid-binding Zn-ribbon protein